MELKDAFVELLRRASTDLPPDVEQALQDAHQREEQGSAAKGVFETILENVDLARRNSTPICQDTGAIIYYIDYPRNTDEGPFRAAGTEAAREATRRYYLRPNAVDPVSGKNSGDNVGINAPYFHFHQWDHDHVRVRLMLKGGGSENVGTQYKLPDMGIGAGRDLGGIRKCVIDAVHKAQGFGCAPGTIGVGIGGDRASSYLLSKEQFFRKLGSLNQNPQLAEMEKKLMADLNSLGVGPMGFGGRTTVLGVHVGAQHRHPATFYVSVSYMCWAYRRKTMILSNGEVDYED
jgi:fumarate hydratase class I